VGLSWYDAAAYCNWLSNEEGIDPKQWCYETDARGKVTKLRKSYLSLAGYRLPTEAEMEYATRAGALTSRYSGETAALLSRYAWYQQNSHDKTWPVGSLKPNDLGLFDVQGNVYTWCQERSVGYRAGQGKKAAEDQEDELVVIGTDSRVLRGGSFVDLPPLVRSAIRRNDVPMYRANNFGFRPARTFLP
jgi:formylglycine-generating enzyme required for sulfatase activity